MAAENYSGQVLIVDDDVITAELLQAEFEESGFRVTMAHDRAGSKRSIVAPFLKTCLNRSCSATSAEPLPMPRPIVRGSSSCAKTARFFLMKSVHCR